MAHFDAILIPGGGLTRTGELTPFVQARLDRALTHSADLYIPLSAGTPHTPPPLDNLGYPIFESIPAAQYLHAGGIPAERIVVEACSYDTIGNAFFARTVHTDPRGLRRLLIVNSEFHMPRTEAIFAWIFGAEGNTGTAPYELTFETTPNTGISPDALAARAAREQASLTEVKRIAAELRTLAEIHGWVFTQHAAYAWSRRDESYIPATGSILESYGGAR